MSEMVIEKKLDIDSKVIKVEIIETKIPVGRIIRCIQITVEKIILIIKIKFHRQL